MPLLPGKAASHHRPHGGQTLKFIKELSANISRVNATAELPSSLHLRRPYTWFLWGISETSSSQDKALPPCSAQEKGQDISTLKAVNGAGVEPIWKSLIFSVSASQAAAAASSSSRAQSVGVFLRKQLEPGWEKTCWFFLYSPSSKTVPPGPGFQCDHSKYNTHTSVEEPLDAIQPFAPSRLFAIGPRCWRRSGCLLPRLSFCTEPHAKSILVLAFHLRVLEVPQINTDSAPMELSPMAQVQL